MRKKLRRRRGRKAEPDEMRPFYDFSNAMPNKYAEDVPREVEGCLKKQPLPRRQPMLIVKSPDPEGTRDICFRDMSLREIAESSRDEALDEYTPPPSPPPKKSRSGRKKAKKRP